MSKIEDYGTRNSFKAEANEKLVTEKTERDMTDMSFFKDKTGRGWMRMTVDKDFTFSLPGEEMIGLAWFDSEDCFHKENAQSVHSIEFRDEKGLQCIVPKEDIIGFLDGTGAGRTQLTICMDNGFTRKGAFTYDVNKAARGKLNAIIRAISPALGLESRDLINGAYFRKAVVDENGREMSLMDIANRYAEVRRQGVVPKLTCRLTIDNRGIHSIEEIDRV